MKSRILSGLAVAACFFVIGISPASGQCPTVEWVCDYWPPLLGYSAVPTGNFCEGPDCFDMNYGAEMRMVAVDDEGLFPETWMLWTGGDVTTIEGSIECEIKRVGNHNKVVLPEPLHCVFSIETDNHLYLEFIASIPESECVGWVECEVW